MAEVKNVKAKPNNTMAFVCAKLML